MPAVLGMSGSAGRLALAAAKPVIASATIVIDHGRVFVSQAFLSACRTLGVSVQPARPCTPADKAAGPLLRRSPNRYRSGSSAVHADVPGLAALLGSRRAGAVTIGQALHWMRYRELIPALVPLLRPGGGIAVITNGTPMWLQDSPWSRALRGFLEQWLGSPAASA